MIKFNQNTWLKSYSGKNIDVRKESIKRLWENFFKFLNKKVFRKTKGNVRKQRDIKFFITERWRTYLGSEPNYHTTKK